MTTRLSSPKSKLSTRQAEVLRLMAEGWELRRFMGITISCWLQKNGRGGISQRVLYDTFQSLLDRKLIALKRSSFPIASYELAKP